MLASDAPEAKISGWGQISLPEYMDWNRNGAGWTEDVVAWHITTADRVASIMATGLRATSCANWTSNGAERPAAVYMFCAESVVAANIAHLLDNSSAAAVLRITIPARCAGQLRNDNIYNMSVDAAEMSAMQFLGDVPAAWIA